MQTHNQEAQADRLRGAGQLSVHLFLPAWVCYARLCALPPKGSERVGPETGLRYPPAQAGHPMIPLTIRQAR